MQTGKLLLPEGQASFYSPGPSSHFPRTPDLNPTGYTMKKKAFILGFIQETSNHEN